MVKFPGWNRNRKPLPIEEGFLATIRLWGSHQSGADETFDIAIKEGGTGINHFALQIMNEEDIRHYEKKLSNLGVSTQHMTNPEPGKKVALRFAAPTNHQIELVLVEDQPQ